MKNFNLKRKVNLLLAAGYFGLFVLVAFSYGYTTKVDVQNKMEETTKEGTPWDKITGFFTGLADAAFTKSNTDLTTHKITSAIDCVTPPPAMLNTVTAINSGRWEDAATWSSGSIPASKDMVVIPAGINIEVRRKETARIRYIEVMGTLTMNPTSNSQLLVETLMVQPIGALIIGTATTPVSANVSAEIVFLDYGAITDPTKTDRGLVVMGTCSMYGVKKTGFVPANGAGLGSNSITVDGAMGDFWQIGDQIVIPSTTFNPGPLSFNERAAEVREGSRPTREQIANTFQDEKVTITGINGNTISFSPSLKFNHIKPKPSLPFHIANLSRNIIFRSESAGVTSRRGHTMFMAGSKVHIQGVRFYQLGRTDKRIPLDDLEELGKDSPDRGMVRKNSPANIQNHRGRYAVHFHKNGINESDLNVPLATVTNSVVEDVPGWGYVNHSSHVDFRNNVCFNFTGSGFVTEQGDELGTFDNNIAIQGHGNGELRGRRLGFNTPSRSPSINDFGFGGDGFWFQGPAVTVTNNIAASCNGSGIIFFTTGSVDDSRVGDQYTYGNFTGLRQSVAKKLYPTIGTGNFNPRRIRVGYENVNEVVYLNSDIPILKCSGNVIYSSHTGYTQRFNNGSNGTFFTQLNFKYTDGFESTGNLVRQTQLINNQILWNNFIAMSTSYTENNVFNNFTIYNGVRRHYNNLNDRVLDWAIAGTHSDKNRYENFNIDGYGIGGIIGTDRRGNLTGDIVQEQNVIHTALVEFPGSNNDNSDGVPLNLCDDVSLGTATWSANNTIGVAFSSDTKQKQIAVRYKAADDIYWTYTNAVTSSGFINVVVPKSNVAYDYQVLRGCNAAVSKEWSLTGRIDGQSGNRIIADSSHSFAAYPNPAIAQLTVDLNNSEGKAPAKQISVYNLTGRKILESIISSKNVNKKTIDISSFPSGIYMVEVLFEDGVKTTKQVMVKN
jgi:Secretion system C-terminal sorting domain/G8 domain